MPYSYRIDANHAVVLFKATGVFSSSEFLGCLKVVIADPEFERALNHLVDLREVSDFQVARDDMYSRTHADRMEPQIDGCRMALVSSRDSVYGWTRMYETMMEGAPALVRTFKNMRDATEWLGIPEASA